jgi:hypothetical protein
MSPILSPATRTVLAKALTVAARWAPSGPGALRIAYSRGRWTGIHTAARTGAPLDPHLAMNRKSWRVALSRVPRIKQIPYETQCRQEIESGRRIKSFHDRNIKRRSWVQDAKSAAENVLREYNRDALEYQKCAVHALQYPSPSPLPEINGGVG